MNLRATMLDDPAWFAPFVETCTAEKLRLGRDPGASHSYAGLPPEADCACGSSRRRFAAWPLRVPGAVTATLRRGLQPHRPPRKMAAT